MIKRHGFAAASIVLCVVAIVLLAADKPHPAVYLVLVALAIALLSPLVNMVTGNGDG